MTNTPLRILTLTTLYPNKAMPSHGVFVENRLRDFHRETNAEIKIIAPVPWFPSTSSKFGKYSAFAKAPYEEDRFGLTVLHPRYFIPPRIGMTYAPTALERCFFRQASQLLRDGWDFDAIDAHYLYPDGVAAARVAKKLGKPVILTARGSDVSLLPTFPRQRKMILDAVAQADKIICVATALKNALVDLGALPDKIVVLRNGVDLDQFRPMDRDAIRTPLNIDNFCLLSVGHLIERKGHNFVISALKEIENATLLIAGEGPEETRLKNLTKKLGLTERVRFLGRVDHERLTQIYNAADVMILASSREGWPNVLLESMACGTPTIATDIWGNGEVIQSGSGGMLLKERSARAISTAVKSLKETSVDRQCVRHYAEKFSWKATSLGLFSIFEELVSNQKIEKSIKVSPIKTKQTTTPNLLMTVDTEESFEWNAFDPDGHKICDTKDISKFQSLCEKHSVKPLYFVTYPLISDNHTSTYFKALYDQGKADLGLHLHGWNTPPIVETAHVENSWQSNLPVGLQTEKLEMLADAFEQAFGFRAIAHRAGRYGIDLKAYMSLAKIGISHDFSPCPGFDFSEYGGPDFTAMSPKTFRVSVDGFADIVVIPVTGGRGYRGLNRFEPFNPKPGLQHPNHQRNKLTLPLRLTCENATMNGAMAFATETTEMGVNPITFSLHSSSMTVGGSPYAKNKQMVSNHLTFIDTFIKKFRTDLGGKIISLQDIVEQITT